MSIWEKIAEAKILTAIQSGDFSALEGFGRPSPIDIEEYDEHWWIRRKLNAEGLRLKVLCPAILPNFGVSRAVLPEITCRSVMVGDQASM